jgi:hypothetical protein
MAPHRLLRIQPNKVQLHLTSGVPYRYATLSHCWGNAKTLKLTTGTFSTFLEGIPWSLLPKTFQDAINVALEFGVQYIWIDSLCIRQDDPMDWQIESAEMCNIYQGSFLNIAASGAVDGTVGCFFERDETWNCRIRVNTKDGTNTDYLCVPQHIYDVRLAAMLLMRRGWVLQEWLLAPRTLFFTSKELFWMCGVKTACETFPSGLPKVITQASPSAKPQMKRSSWERIVEEYSRCQLTFKTDKLVAISGIAQYIGKETKSLYTVRMWRKDFEGQLCWHVADRRTLKGDECPYPWRAPSWSWASTDSEVVLPTKAKMGMSQLYVKLQDVQVKLAGRDPFGGAITASLRLRATALIFAKIVINGIFEKSTFIVAGQSVDCWVNMDYTCEVFERFCIMPVIRHHGRHCYIDALVLKSVDVVRGTVHEMEELEDNVKEPTDEVEGSSTEDVDLVYSRDTKEKEKRWVKSGRNGKRENKQSKVIEATDIVEDSGNELEEQRYNMIAPIHTIDVSNEELQNSSIDEMEEPIKVSAKPVREAKRWHRTHYQRVGHLRIDGVQACHDFNKLIKSSEVRKELYRYTTEFGKGGRWTGYDIDLM